MTKNTHTINYPFVYIETVNNSVMYWTIWCAKSMLVTTFTFEFQKVNNGLFFWTYLQQVLGLVCHILDNQVSWLPCLIFPYRLYTVTSNRLLIWISSISAIISSAPLTLMFSFFFPQNPFLFLWYLVMCADSEETYKVFNSVTVSIYLSILSYPILSIYVSKYLMNNNKALLTTNSVQTFLQYSLHVHRINMRSFPYNRKYGYLFIYL